MQTAQINEYLCSLFLIHRYGAMFTLLCLRPHSGGCILYCVATRTACLYSFSMSWLHSFSCCGIFWRSGPHSYLKTILTAYIKHPNKIELKYVYFHRVGVNFYQSVEVLGYCFHRMGFIFSPVCLYPRFGLAWRVKIWMDFDEIYNAAGMINYQIWSDSYSAWYWIQNGTCVLTVHRRFILKCPASRGMHSVECYSRWESWPRPWIARKKAQNADITVDFSRLSLFFFSFPRAVESSPYSFWR